MIIMHGFFDLKNPDGESEFKTAYQAFAAHLITQHLIVASRVTRRTPNKNYDSSPPTTNYYISMDFTDADQAQVCWDYIEAHEEISTQLHRTVYAKIKNYSFFLSEDL